MASYYTKNNTNGGGQIVTQQQKTDRGTDGRSWRAFKQNGSNIDTYDFKILDDFTIGKWVNGEYIEKSSSVSANSLDKITIAIDRDCEYLYILTYYTIPAVGFYCGLTVCNIADMTTETIINLYIDTTPIKAQITSAGDKIIWLGDNNTLYSMDLDGGNLLSVTVGDYAYTFTFNSSNIAYVLCSNVSANWSPSRVHRINTATLVKETYEASVLYYSNGCVGGFHYNGVNYFCLNLDYSTWDDGVSIVSFADADWNNKDNWNIVNLTTTDSIESDTVVKFFLTKDSTGWYGVLYENDEIDRKYCYKVDLDTLALTPLRQVSATTDKGDYLEQTSIFSDDDTTYPIIATRGATGSNGDEGGGQWMQINS